MDKELKQAIEIEIKKLKKKYSLIKSIRCSVKKYGFNVIVRRGICKRTLADIVNRELCVHVKISTLEKAIQSIEKNNTVLQKKN